MFSFGLNGALNRWECWNIDIVGECSKIALTDFYLGKADRQIENEIGISVRDDFVCICMTLKFVRE